MGAKTAAPQLSSKLAAVSCSKISSHPTRSGLPATGLQQRIGNAATMRVLRPSFIQPKLTVSHPEDESEREADRVADQVMRMPEPASPLRKTAGVEAVQTSDQPVQMQRAPEQTKDEKQPMQPTGDPTTGMLPKALQQSFQKALQDYIQTDEIKKPIVKELATGYLNRLGKMEIPDRAIPNSPYVIPGVHDPSYSEVYNAIYNAIDINELVKGKWDWKDAAVRKKTRDEKLGEIGAFAFEEFTMGKLQDTVVKTAISWATKESLLVTATFTLAEAAAATAVTLLAIEVIGMASLVIGVYELAKSISAPAKLSPYQEKDVNIAAAVKAWWQEKQEAADLLNTPFKPETIPAAVRSTTRIGP